jgi:Uncharacterized protein conserved in bacteria C-term(DUF2220)
LLDDAGLNSAAERNAARAEVETLGKEGNLLLRHHKYRTHILESISLPPAWEPWLLSLVDAKSAQDLQSQALSLVLQSRAGGHSRWPESWQRLCENVLSAFEHGQNLSPFFWSKPKELGSLLTTLHGLTAREWPANTLIRDASVALGLSSKFLEKKQPALESGMGVLFGEETTLESLGLVGSQSQVTIHGRLSLHFADGSIQHFEHLRAPFSISLSDLQRSVRISTDAGQILSIENAKTTFRQAVAANFQGGTLLVATSYPNAATRLFLEVLPAELPHHHFGDTDVSGYAILCSLRELSVRRVEAFQMNWSDKAESEPLSEHDRRILPHLMKSPLMEDCLPFLAAMERLNRKGDYEQESRGMPHLTRWPFWKSASHLTG